jgi:hypothetical protein
MLPDAEILALLAHCERATGTVLKQVRGNLRSDDHWLFAVWELVVGEAASMLGRIQYEGGVEGMSRPDWLLELPDGKRIWLEAAFSVKSSSANHPLGRILQSKADQAKKSAVPDPVVACIGTDRVFQLGHLQLGLQSGRRRDSVVARFFERRASLAAVIIVPILLRLEVFVGFARDAEPKLLKNPRARYPLSDSAENQLQRLDFNRRRVSIGTAPPAVPGSLRAAIEQLGQGPSAASTSASHGPDAHPKRATWSYTWHFNHLRIERFDASYCLLNRNELMGRFASPEEAARTAADLLQPFPGKFFGPHGIKPDPDLGVPPDLDKWHYDPGETTST